MRLFLLITGLALLWSCQTAVDHSGRNDSNALQTDTFSITYQRYLVAKEQTITDDQQLVRVKQGDSLLSFRYFKDTALIRQIDFRIDGDRFELIQPEESSPNWLLVVVDTFSLNILGEDQRIYKYELQHPPIDGDIGLLFSPTYGQIGSSAYDWGSAELLTHWNGHNLKAAISSALLAEDAPYLKPQQNIPPPLPGQPGKIEIVEDEEEIEE